MADDLDYAGLLSPFMGQGKTATPINARTLQNSYSEGLRPLLPGEIAPGVHRVQPLDPNTLREGLTSYTQDEISPREREYFMNWHATQDPEMLPPDSWSRQGHNIKTGDLSSLAQPSSNIEDRRGQYEVIRPGGLQGDMSEQGYGTQDLVDAILLGEKQRQFPRGQWDERLLGKNDLTLLSLANHVRERRAR